MISGLCGLGFYNLWIIKSHNPVILATYAEFYNPKIPQLRLGGRAKTVLLRSP